MSNNQSKVSLRHTAFADHLRRKSDSRLMQTAGMFLKAWRAANTRPVKRSVPMDRLLCGGENGLPAATYARHTGDFLRPSKPFAESPHVRFLEQYRQIGEEIFRPEVFRQTNYFANAVECMNVIGQYFSCTREEQIEGIARGFVSRFQNKPLADDDAHRGPEFSAPDSMISVRGVAFSDCYEVIDGNHRLAISHVRGEKTQTVLVSFPAAQTPLQQLLMDYAWCAMRGERELYQPVESPELGAHWMLIRRCSDRFELIERFLEEHRAALPHDERPTYLDVACSYGWFVRAFGQAGFDAHGVEMDWAATEIGRRVYELKPEQVKRSDAVRFLQSDARSYDVVSCFSLLHHFILNRASINAVEMLKLLDRATKTILFLDTGQEHEEWFRESLAGWNADRIEGWLRENSTFTKIYRLGTDRDNVPPFENNYARTLFACMR